MTFNLNTSGFSPYKNMGQSCDLKDITEFQVNWPKLETTRHLTDNKLDLRYMRQSDVADVIELWKDVYPEVYGSTHQFVFDSEWYDDSVLFEENWKKDAKEKQYAIIIMEDHNVNQLIGILLMTKWDQNLQIELTMGGFHSSSREKNVFYPFFKGILDSISNYVPKDDTEARK